MAEKSEQFSVRNVRFLTKHAILSAIVGVILKA